MINLHYAKKFCKDDISLIENYYKAINDKTQTWHCHHRREINEEGSFAYSKKDLKDMDLYYNRPAEELIFLTPHQHITMHNKGQSEETKKKKSESAKGEKNPMFGRKGEKNPMFGKKGEKSPCYGRKHSEETKKKWSEDRKGEKNPMFGTHWKLVDGKRVYY